MTYQRNGAWSLVGPIVVTVDNGRVSTALSDNPPVGTLPFTDPTGVTVENRVTVNDLFAEIQGHLDKNVDGLRVSFDAETGHPTSIYVDHSINIHDEEYSITISDFVRL